MSAATTSAVSGTFAEGDVIIRADRYGSRWWQLGQFVRYATDDELTGGRGALQVEGGLLRDRVCWLRDTEVGSRPFVWWASQVRYAYCEQVWCRAADEPYRASMLVKDQHYSWAQSCGACYRMSGGLAFAAIGPLPFGPAGGFRFRLFTGCRDDYRAWLATLGPADRAQAGIAEAACRDQFGEPWGWVRFARPV